MSEAATPTATEAPALDDRDVEPRTPMKRLGSTRKLAAFNNIRLQLSEQTRVLEARAEATAGVAAELHDYCRRRADLEHEYARALDKLARAATARHKDQKHKREQWSLTGAYSCWQAALEHTRALSRDHAALGELYAGPLAARLQRAADDAQRLHRKCRDIVAERHEELGAALAEAAGAAKAHGAAAADWRAAALKLRHAYDQRQRVAAADPPRHKKLKALDKELDKRRARHSDARVRALRARADYVLSLEAANATLQRYYLDDIADIILCMEVGFEAAVGRVARTAGAAERECGAAAGAAAAPLLGAAAALDALGDRQRVLAAHAAAFALPRPLPYAGAPPDAQDRELRALLADAAHDDAQAERARRELAARLLQLDEGARRLRAECQENAKTLDAAETELVKQMEGSDSQWDVSGMFGAGAGAPPPGAPPVPEEQEDYYLRKFRAYVASATRLARLESKARGVRTRLLGAGGAGGGAGGAAGAGGAGGGSPPRRALRPRGAWAAPLDARLPRVLTACVRVVATYGLRHQGVFRVSGSQLEMQALRQAFERGEDPLAEVRDAADINSVCGLLKLYLREVRPPLLPPQLQERLLRVAALADDEQFVRRMRETLSALPLPAVLVLRYLFAFLAHLAEYSEYNMMDAWNLAICLGPTLLAAWGEGGAQVTAQNLVNELVKRIILHHRDVFPQDVAPYALYSRHSEADESSGAAGAAPEHEQNDEREQHDPHDQHDQHDQHDERDERDLHDEHDAPDDLSLYDIDDDDTDEISDDDAESGDWGSRDSADYPRCGGAAAQVEVADDETSAAATSATAPCRRLADTTPDLVLDLPARAPPPASDTPAAASATPGAPPADAADTFVHNRDTLKKRPARRHSRSDADEAGPAPPAPPAPPEPAAPAQGSPVPARNTARVAAKFAELTLTGGSLKPALAAKPALLRRPTPHPQPARAAPAPELCAAPAPRTDPAC